MKQLPIEARPHSWIDRLTKYSRRNRGPLLKLTAYMILATFGGYLMGQWLVETWTSKNDRTIRLGQAIDEAELAMLKAEASPNHDSATWDIAEMKLDRIREIREEGPIRRDIRMRCKETTDRLAMRIIQQKIEEQIEEVLVRGATNPDLESWKKMEVEMRDFFRNFNFDLDEQSPADIGRNIRNHRWSYMWADLLELWIGARGQMASLGGPKLNANIMQPWAEAMYEADPDPIRTGIRRFIYTPPRKVESLDALIKDVDLSQLRPRTLAWLGHSYGMVNQPEKSIEIFDIAIQQYPRDFMLNFDFAYLLFHQQKYDLAARYFHRCLTIRDDVPGVWRSLSKCLEELGETKRAERMLRTAEKLEQEEEEEVTAAEPRSDIPKRKAG